MQYGIVVSQNTINRLIICSSYFLGIYLKKMKPAEISAISVFTLSLLPTGYGINWGTQN